MSFHARDDDDVDGTAEEMPLNELSCPFICEISNGNCCNVALI
jgi:hypothetical protein